MSKMDAEVGVEPTSCSFKGPDPAIRRLGIIKVV